MTDQPLNSQQLYRPIPARPQHNDEIDLAKYFYLFLGNWYWFALALFLSVGTAYFVNRYATKVYRVNASLLIEDQSSNPMGSSMFGGSDMMSGFGMYPSYYNFQNQILIMKSENLVSKTLYQLDFSVSYYRDELFGPKEIWNEAPFIVVPDYSKIQSLGVHFIVTLKNDGSLNLASDITGESTDHYDYRTEKSSSGTDDLNLDQTIRYNEKIEGEGYSFVIIPRNEDQKNGKVKPGTWFFSFESYDQLISKWSSSLKLKSLDKDASMVSLSLETACPEKAQLFLKKHLEVYLQRTLDKKNMVATNTINFIDKQLTSISDSLDITGMNLQNYRKNNQVVDLSFQAQQLFEQAKDLDNQKAILKIKDDYFKYLMEYVGRNRDAGDLVTPSIIGIEDPLLNSLVLEINKMADQKIAMKGAGSGENPYLITLESQISNLKTRLEENTKNLLNNNDMALTDIEKRLGTLMAEIRKLPQTERELLGIERKFKLNDNIYTYMLQRRAESQITKASNTPDNEIIDSARIDKTPVYPRTRINYLIAILVGLGFPFLWIILVEFINFKVRDEEDIVNITDMPIAGHVPHSKLISPFVVFEDPHSHVAEAFRSLRSKMQFFTKDIKSPIILISSSMPAEGKTFTAINLASAYSLMDKKTVLVGFDLRKPKIYNDFGIDNDQGVSTWLIGRDSLDDVIKETNHKNLSIIPAGPIPPNPSELTSSTKTDELLNLLREKFDYIIIDTPPIGSVSDTFHLATLADTCLIIVRLDKTLNYLLERTIHELQISDIKNASLVLNDINLKGKGYGYGGKYSYGYGYNNIYQKEKDG